MTLLKSWVSSANDGNHPFPLNNLPHGVFSTEATDPRCGVAIGDMILDCRAAEEAGLINLGDSPLFDVPWPYVRDRSVSRGQLRHGGHVFLKGLGMHSDSRLAYAVAAQYAWLDAELGIDQRAGSNGSVIFRVYVQDADGAWSKAYESDVIRGSGPLVPIHVDIRGAVRLALIVDSADRLDVWDHANWINARLVGRRLSAP